MTSLELSWIGGIPPGLYVSCLCVSHWKWHIFLLVKMIQFPLYNSKHNWCVSFSKLVIGFFPIAFPWLRCSNHWVQKWLGMLENTKTESLMKPPCAYKSGASGAGDHKTQDITWITWVFVIKEKKEQVGRMGPSISCSLVNTHPTLHSNQAWETVLPVVQKLPWGPGSHS